MKISKSAWHYRLATLFSNDYDVPNSLCPYVRKCMLSVMWVIVFAAVIGAMLWFFIVSPICFWLNWFDVIHFSDELVKMGIGAQGVWGIFGLAALCHHIQLKLKYRNRDVVKEPGIVRAYIKAKKDKFCPTLEFVNE